MTDEFRPTSWHEYIGQEDAKDSLDMSIQSALARRERMDHVFLYGPPGSGKTSLAGVIAHRLRLDLKAVVMPLSDTALKALVMQNHGVVLMDEIHRASKKQQEGLLTLLEDGELSQPSGFNIPNHDLMIIGATTERGKVIKPLYDRFLIKPEFDPYTEDQMAAIAFGMLKRAGLHQRYDMEFAKALGLAAGGVPRNVKSMVVAVRDLISSGREAQPTIDHVLKARNVTHDGLTRLHIDYLTAMGKNGGAALGLKTLCSQIQASEEMVTEAETLLFQRGFILYTKSGRELTAEGWKRANALLGQT